MSRRSDRLREQADMEADWKAQQNERPNITTRYEPRSARVPDVPQADAHHCFRCHLLKTGRFTRDKRESDQGWSQNMHRGRWSCWECLPYGEGRGETPKGTADAER